MSAMTRASVLSILAFCLAGATRGDDPSAAQDPLNSGPSPIDQTISACKSTGQPFVAIVNGPPTSCKKCALKTQLSLSDPGIQQALGRAVTVTLDPKTNPQLFELVRKAFPRAGAYPSLVVVRGDGEQLYAGTVTPDNFRSVLMENLAKAGEPISPAVSDRMKKALADAEKRANDKDIAKAVGTIAPFLGSGSYAEAALAIEKFGGKLTEDGKKAIEEAESQLQSPATALDGAIAYLQAVDKYGRLPDLIKSSRANLSKHKKDASLRTAFQQADSLVKASDFEAKGNSRRAIAAYQTVAQRYSGTPAAQRALERISALGGEAPKGKATSASSIQSPEGSEEADSKSVQRAESNLRLAKSFAKNNDMDKAKAYAEKAIAAAPRSDVARQAQALIANTP